MFMFVFVFWNTFGIDSIFLYGFGVGVLAFMFVSGGFHASDWIGICCCVVFCIWAYYLVLLLLYCFGFNFFGGAKG